jgi:hypothetical protein
MTGKARRQIRAREKRRRQTGRIACSRCGKAKGKKVKVEGVEDIHGDMEGDGEQNAAHMAHELWDKGGRKEIRASFCDSTLRVEMSVRMQVPRQSKKEWNSWP